MFTPSRTRSSGLASNRRSTPRVNALKNTPRSTLIRRSLNPRASLNVTNTSFASPNVTAQFSSLKHSIDPFETSIPVLVTEAIALAEDVSNISVKIGKNGWSLLVNDQKLFIWSHQSGSSKIPTCKELVLRGIDDDDNYSAELSAVNYNEDTGAVSVIAVSVSGQIMFWPNILASTATFHENKISTTGIRCFNICSVERYGFILSTSNSSFYHIHPEQNSITFKEMSKWEGALSRIGRRVSSFFFSSSTTEQNVIQVQVIPSKKHNEYSILVLTGSYLYRWKCVFNDERDVESVQLLNEVDINEVVATKISVQIWDCIKPRLNMVPLDVQLANVRGHVAVLVAVSESTDMDAWVYYAVALLTNNLDEVQIIMFQHTDLYSSMINEADYDYDLVVEDSNAKTLQHFVMWSKKHAILKSLISTSGDYMEENVPFDGSGDCVLGVGSYSGRLIIFSALYGLMTSSCLGISQSLPSLLTESMMEGSFMSPPASTKSLPGTPAISQSKIDQLETSENSAQRLQAAFLHYCKLNMDQAQSLISEAFPPGVLNEVLDSAAVALSGELLDDYPAQDPRWAESVPRDIAAEAAGSFILLHQLEDKLKAHSLFLKFLIDVSIWDTLSVLGSGRDKMVTRWMLWEHTEKLHAAISLLQNHSAHQTLVDEVIRKVLNHRENMTNIAGLTPRDYFYREITKIEEIFEYLLAEEDNALMKSSLSSRERATMVASVNTIMEAMLNSAHRCRKSRTLTYNDSNHPYIEYLPWTVGSGRSGIRDVILQQIKTTVERGIPEAEDIHQRTILHQSLTCLIDLLLEGYQQQITSLSYCKSSQARKSEVQIACANHRSQVLTPLLKIGLREQAAGLAEKFSDFDILIQICDQTNDDVRLQKYLHDEDFVEQGFAEFLFRWYLERKDYKKLLSCGKFEAKKLKLFLKGHPHLAWMEQIQSHNYVDAHSTLSYLASVEEDSISKKKTLLSLSKLALVFSGEEKNEISDRIEAINQEQLLVKYQQSLPQSASQPIEDGEVDMPVYSASKLIQLYIDEDNGQATEADFKKAFELLSYLPPVDMHNTEDVDADEWKMRIWCRLILRDNWKDVDTMLDPSDSCSHTMLFKTASLAISSGLFEDIVPDTDVLLRRAELSNLCEDSSFRYLLKASFESMNRSREMPA